MMAAEFPAPHAQASAHAALPPASQPMRVSLAFVAQRVNVYLRFGRPAREVVLDRWRRVAVFMPGSVCCRIKWLGNDFGTALWQLMVLQAPTPLDGMQRVSGVSPGARTSSSPNWRWRRRPSTRPRTAT